jgi:hypothetical protein
LLRRLALLSFLLAGCAEHPRVAPTPKPVAASGLRVYRDPVTGAFVEPPPPAPGAAPQRAAPAAAPPALAETASPVAGAMVRLGGAFHSDVTARVGARGAEVSCATAAAPR